MRRLIAATALIVPLYAHAWSFEHGAGVTLYGTENGRWYQDNMPMNEVQSRAPEFSFGITGALVTRGSWGVDWHADYTNLGRAAAQCFCTSDENYDLKRKRKIRADWPNDAFFTGAGRAQGIVLSVEPYYWTHGLRLGVEAGAYVYRAQWDEYADIKPAPVTIHTRYWSVAPVVGISVGGAVWSLSYRHYFLKRANMEYPALWNDADVIEIKRRF